jgi:cell division protein FtsB
MAERIASQSAELEQLHRDFDALVDHLKDAIGDDLKAHVDPIIGFVDEDLTRAVGAMRTGLEKLRAENARLKAPVTDPEMIALYCHCNPPTLQQMELLRLQARQAYRVIKARAQEPRKESNDASS